MPFYRPHPVKDVVYAILTHLGLEMHHVPAEPSRVRLEKARKA